MRRFMAWMGYVMASVGFSWDILVLVGILLRSLGKITPDQEALFFQAGYVVLVSGFLFSGYAIMFQSRANAYRPPFGRQHGRGCVQHLRQYSQYL